MMMITGLQHCSSRMVLLSMPAVVIEEVTVIHKGSNLNDALQLELPLTSSKRGPGRLLIVLGLID